MHKDLRSALNRLALRLGLTVAESYDDVGALSVDKHAGGTRLVRITSAKGGERPIGPRFKSRAALISHIDFACDVLDETKWEGLRARTKAQK